MARGAWCVVSGRYGGALLEQAYLPLTTLTTRGVGYGGALLEQAEHLAVREQPVPLAEEHRGARRPLDAECEHAALHVVARLQQVVSGEW